ncbi:TBC1 domain family member 12-like isoform X3 [Larimichthys crocea]|uniref:TBC1 domain family member 12-like isoform X3 n=1 Tax=Larimichthys crocea TaxID=215358 RepID=UPI000F5F5F55|nr:TBC1 domain family member 12-like isoform X3 [Larimichthys crocea]
METSDDESLVTSPCRHCHLSSTVDVITQGQTCPGGEVTCSGDGEEVASRAQSHCVDHTTCTLCCGSHDGTHGPIRRSDEDQGAELCLRDDVILTDRISPNMDMEGSKVNRCHQQEGGGHCGGRATGGTDLYLDEPFSQVTSDSDTQEGDLTSDPPVFSDDDAFTELLQLGELNHPAPASATTTTTATPSRNTYECGRRQSAPGQLVQDDGGPESELQSRRPGIIEYFSRKQRSISQSVPGWKLFGKVPPKQSPSKQARIIQQQSAEISQSSLSSPDFQEFEARQVSGRNSPTHHAAGQQSRRKVEFEPLSTTGLILEDRPPNLPAKSAEETQRHRQQYKEMVAGAKRRELKEAQRKQQQLKERVRQEEEIANAMLVWNQNILPQWDTMRSSRRAQDLWWVGLPPSVRGRVWSHAIGNELNITAELYDIFLCRAKEKWGSVGTAQTADGASADGESSLDLITRDVSRTFPSLCVFQKGGPYHDLLKSILGAYTCYRPDVGYVQGMSSMAAMLILNMDEVEAFVTFSNLMNRPCQLAFCRGDHQLMFRYFRAFQVFFEETLPRLFAHFQSSGLTPDLYLMDWILSLYTKPLPLDVACRVWDVFFRDGEEFLFRTALGILRLHQDVLLHMDLISIAQFLSRLPDEELLSDRLFSCISASVMLSGNRKWSQVLLEQTGC